MMEETNTQPGSQVLRDVKKDTPEKKAARRLKTTQANDSKKKIHSRGSDRHGPRKKGSVAKSGGSVKKKGKKEVCTYHKKKKNIDAL